MKISKLFHWLYAILMLLPFAFFVPSCLYYCFNKYSTNENVTEITYKYESNNVYSNSDLIEGHVYRFHFEGAQPSFECRVLFGEILEVNVLEYVELYTSSYNVTALSYTPYYYFLSNRFYAYAIGDTLSVAYQDVSEIDMIVTYKGMTGTFDNLYTFFEYTDFNVVDSVTNDVEDTIPNKINTSWNSVWDLPIFSWCKNSFVTIPFSYITGLFGVLPNSSINYVFTYFASMSIIWLVFDVILYVPLLVHRWLDKGIVE